MCGMKKIEKEFEQISAFIERSRNAAVGFMNYAAISTYWAVGAYVWTPEERGMGFKGCKT